MPAAFTNLLSLQGGKRRQIRTVPSASDARELAHNAEKALLALKADAGAVRQRDHAGFDTGVVGKSAEVAEHAGIGLRTAEAEAGGDRKRHLVAAVREHSAARPTVPRQHVQRRVEIFPGRQRRRVALCKLGEKREIERVARLLEPPQLERQKRSGIAQ